MKWDWIQEPGGAAISPRVDPWAGAQECHGDFTLQDGWAGEMTARRDWAWLRDKSLNPHLATHSLAPRGL